MKIELLVLTGAVILGFVQLMWASALATKERGTKWNLSSRDVKPPPLSVHAGRVDRALQNFKETFPLFVAAIVVVIASDRSGPISHVGAITYLAARVLYIPLLVGNVIGVRSLVWVISGLGIAAILVQALFF